MRTKHRNGKAEHHDDTRDRLVADLENLASDLAAELRDVGEKVREDVRGATVKSSHEVSDADEKVREATANVLAELRDVGEKVREDVRGATVKSSHEVSDMGEKVREATANTMELVQERTHEGFAAASRRRRQLAVIVAVTGLAVIGGLRARTRRD